MHRIGNLRRSGRTGKRAGLKIPWPQGREGASPFPAPPPVFTQSRSRGVKPASGAERQGGYTPQPHHRPEQNQEMSPVDRERGSPEPRRKGRWRDRRGSGGRAPPPAPLFFR